MLRKSFIAAFLSIIFLPAITFAAESEPNDTWNTADALTLAVTDNGSIASGSDIDWWKISIPANGQLNIAFTGLSGCMNIQVYDTLGIILVNGGAFNCGGTSNVNTNGLSKGTYYIKVFAAAAASYSMQATFTAPAQNNDTEPNNSFSNAQVLAQNGNTTGHFGYYFNNIRDTFDWYRIVTTTNGALQLSYTQNSGNGCGYFQLFDNNGITALNAEVFNCGGTNNQTTDGLQPGTYLVRIRNNNGSFGTYTLSNTLLLPAIGTDPEPNNTRGQARVLQVNNSVTGQFGYRFNGGLRDSVDWWRVTTTVSGLLQLQYTQNTGNGCSYFQLFDNNATTALNGEVFNCGGTNIQNTDGLNPGTYFIRIRPGNTNNFGTYTLKDTLIRPAISTDTEPNNTPAQAITLAVNSTNTGQFGYYYNNLRDSFDWHKITLPVSGALQLQYTQNSGNGCSYFQLFDTVVSNPIALNQEIYNCGGTSTQTTDGLNPGTYFIRIRPGNNGNFGTYSLKDTLILPPYSTDQEPNNSPAQAITLNLNSTTNGQFGYYYKNLRDSFDWHKITLPVSGGLQLQYTQTSGNGCSYFQLFDTVVSTPIALNQEIFNCGGTSTQNTDGLNPGTYYIRIRPANNVTFGTYTLKDSLFALPPDNDNKPNERPFQASTLPANTVVFGDVGYFYNQRRDSADWAKINYTGTGNLTLQFTGLNRAFSGSTCLYLYIYSDTNAAPISTTFNCGGTSTINLFSLAQGYYWIKVQAAVTSEFGPYSINNTFTQVNIAAITLINSTSPANCDSTGVLRYQCSGSRAPYTVQLFRFGVLNRTVRINNSNPFNITNLPTGIWTARVFGDGATGSAFGTTSNTSLMPVPTGLTTTNIQPTQARLNFSNFTPCIDGYAVQYRVTGTGTWTLDTARQSPFTLRNLQPGTTYSWRVASGDTANGFTALSRYSDSTTFTTATAGFTAITQPDNNSVKGMLVTATGVTAFPNPASSQVKLLVGSNIKGMVNATLKDLTGKLVWSRLKADAEALQHTPIAVSGIPNGVYLLQITGINNTILATTKIIVAH